MKNEFLKLSKKAANENVNKAMTLKSANKMPSLKDVLLDVLELLRELSVEVFEAFPLRELVSQWWFI